jgi:zinc transport system ATP-binding protein
MGARQARPLASSTLAAVEIDGVTYAYGATAGSGDSGAGGAADATAAPGMTGLALEGVSLRVEQGERLGILGPNGGGKSTLLKLVLGLLTLDRPPMRTGVIRILGMTPEEARSRGVIGYVPQKVEAELAFPVSARDVVEMAVSRGVAFWKRLPREGRDAVTRALALAGAEDFAERPIGTLSGGQVQRVMLARALAASPRILLLDEPMVGIDPAGQRHFAELIDGINRELGVTVIVVSHDIRTIASGCDRVACLSRTLHSHTSPEGLTPRVLAEVFRHDVSAIFGDVHVDAHAAAACRGHDHGAAGSDAGGVGAEGGPAR